MSEKPRWEKWKGEKRVDYLKRLKEWEKPEKPAIGEAIEVSEDFFKIPIKPACMICHYWVFHAVRNGIGECFRHPKKIITSKTHWCGEFKAK